MSKSRLSQYLEADKRDSNDPDGLLRTIREQLPNNSNDLLDLIITYGSVMAKKGYDSGYEQSKKWPR